MWNPIKTLKKGYDTLSDSAQEGVKYVGTAADTSFEAGLALANHI